MTRAEQEVVISKCADETEYCVYSTDPKETRHFRELLKKTGGREVQHQGGTKFFLPASELRFTAKRHLRLSVEEKARRTERLQATREPAAATA